MFKHPQRLALLGDFGFPQRVAELDGFTVTIDAARRFEVSAMLILAALYAVRRGEIDVLVGTHALFQAEMVDGVERHGDVERWTIVAADSNREAADESRQQERLLPGRRVPRESQDRAEATVPDVARRYRRWKKDDVEALSFIPSKGYGSLPYSDAEQNPNLIRIYVDYRTEPVIELPLET